ncbi:MAG: hypothetical protein IJ033_04055, partial [Clostridia bacterium]|nr:hypothetical protein [Clostridia bacterium]
KEITINGITSSITQKPFTHADVSATLSATSFNYDLDSHKPTPTVTDAKVANTKATLVNDTDYSYAYYVSGTTTAPITGDIVNAGSYDVIITAKGNYSGELTLNYVINKSQVEVEVKDVISIIYGNSYFTTNDNGANYFHESFNASTDRLIVTTNVNNDSDAIKGNWYYNQVLDDYPTVGTHTLKVRFAIDTTDGYDDNYDYVAGTTGITVSLVVAKRPITLTIANQSMTFGENPTANFKYMSSQSAFALKEGSLGLVGGATLADFGTLVCDVTSKTYPSSVSGINSTTASSLLMAGTYAISPKGDVNALEGTLVPNYDYTWENGTFTVAQRNVEFRISAGISKIYGEADPSFAYDPNATTPITHATNLVVENNDNLQLFLVGALSRAEGEDVGSYDYKAHTLRPDAKESYTVADYVAYYNVINYNFTSFVIAGTAQDPVQFSITPREIYFDLSAYVDESIFGDEIVINSYNFEIKNDYVGEADSLVNGDTIKDDFPEFKIIRTDKTTGNDATETITVGVYDLTLRYKVGESYSDVAIGSQSPTTALNANYSVYATEGSWTITKRPIIVAPNNQNIIKTYSEKDPATIAHPSSYTATYNGDSTKNAIVDGYSLNGGLSRVSGEDVGFYLFTQGEVTGANNPNYSITFDNSVEYGLTINPLYVSLKPTDTRTGYANIYNAVTYNDSPRVTIDSIESKTEFIRTLFTATPNPVNNQYGTDEITALGLVVDGAGIKDKIVGAGGGFILPKEYDHHGLGYNTYPTAVGMYDLKLNAVTNGDQFKNYTFTVQQIETLGSFEVQPLQAKIIPWNYDAKDGKFSITYGDPIPELTYKAVDPTNTSVEIDIDNFTGNLKVSGETNADGHFIVGNTHRIVNDSITSDNYHVTVDESVAFTVTPKAVNVSLNGVDSTTNTIKVIYGNAEPIITLLDESTDGDAFFPYTFSINGLVPSVTTGKVDYSPFAYTLTQKVALARANSDVKICGTYAITLGTVESRNANYTYSLDKDYYLEIIPRPLTVTPIAGLNSYYGDSISSDVAYASAYTTLYNSNEYALNGEEYTVLDSDSLENVSTTIALSKDSSDNWMVRVAGMSSAVLFQDAMGNATQTLDGELYVYENGNKLFTFTFTEQNGSLQFNIVANKDNLNTSDYDGSYNYYLNRRSLITSDVLGGQLTVVWVKDSVGYSDITAPVGEYAYNLGTLSSSNYTLVLDAASPKYNVVKRPLIVKLNSMVEITFGDVVDIISNYTVYELGEYESSHAPVVYFTVPSGILTPGYYPITLNTARVEAENPNFAISFNDSEYVEYLVVYKKDITLTPATNQAKEYMEELDKLTFEVDGDFVTGFVPSENAFELFLSGVDDTTNAAPGTYDFLFQVNTETFTYDGDKTITLEECYNVNTNYKDALNNTIKYSITPKQATFKIVYTTDKDGTEVTKELLIDKDQNTSVVHQIKLLDYTAAAQTVKIELVTGATYHNDSVAGKISTYYEGDFMDIVSASGNELYLKDASTYYFEISTEPEDGNFLSYFTKASTTIEVVVGKRSLAEINPSTHVKVQKTYGEADPSFTFDIKSPYGEELMGTLKREVGEDVGTYALTRDTVSNKDGSENTNYVIALKDSVFTIVPKEITLTPAAIVGATKTYGDSDSEIYEDVATGINNEVLRVIYSRVAGENAGNYDLSINLVACLTTDEFGENVAVKDEFGAYVENTNYTVTLAENAGDAKYLIKKRAASVVANGISKVFDGEPVDLSTLSYEVSGVLEDESLVGSITIVSGAPVVVGSYKIELVGFDAAENDNYEVATTNAYCVITPAPISIKADNVSYEYGDTPAPFTYTVTGTVYDGYPLEGELESLGERPSMGAHVIKAGTLDNKEGRNPNYAITFVSGGVCTVNARHITIQVTESVSQVYGDELTAIPFEVVSANGLIPGDSLKGNLAPTGTNVNLEGYDITIGNVQELNTNYVIELDTNGAKYVITPRPITVTAEAKSTVYGYPTEALSYIAEGLIGEDTLEGELECALGTNVGEYTINQGTLYNANYEIVTYNAAKYSITPRAITITIKDAESEYGQEEAELSYYISKGDLLEGDDLNVTLSREAGDAMGTYAIGGTYDNDNYSVEFILGTYTIHKYRAVITVETEYITFIEDGDARSIVAECSSGAEIIFTVKGEEVTNYFRHAGKYTVELTAPETDNYYAPETVYVYITINRPVLKTESSGIDVTLTTESGFDPNLSIEMEKLPTDYMDMVAELTSKQKIVRAFTLTSINESGLIDEVEGKTTVTIKVPTMLSEEKVVQVLVREDGVYNVVDVEVIDGYVTLEVDSLSSFAFITEENNNYLVLILIGVAALIMLGSVMVFLFRKRA